MIPKVVILLCFLVSCSAINRVVRPGLTIQIQDGSIQGQEETVDLIRRHFSYKGIPYAAPPIGNLRFRAPVRPATWGGVRQAFNHGAICPQLGLSGDAVSGNENCLFLNVYTPVSMSGVLPVMVYIHGGGFGAGSGNNDQLGPEIILGENVIYVSVNYRLSVLGFINTGDAESPGNNGLKDIILALRWVQSNIGFFGGNPNDVTILGTSAGGAAVHALVLSPAASGLFHKAMSHSGSLFHNWAFNRDPRSAINRLAINLGISFTTTANLMTQLRGVAFDRLVRTAGRQIGRDANFIIEMLPFVPTIDAISSEPRILTGTPTQMISGGNINRVPYTVGFNSGESMGTITDISQSPSILNRYNNDPHLLIPEQWNILRGSAAANDIISSIRNMYLGGSSTITLARVWDFSNYISDREFIYGVAKIARLQAHLNRIYYFRFAYSGNLSILQIASGLITWNGVLHGDDSFYLNRINFMIPALLPGDIAFTVQRAMVRFWTNFAKFGNPTPNSFDPMVGAASWPIFTTANHSFMNIGTLLQTQSWPNRERMDMWQRLDTLYGPN